ncbi:MAG: helix-turn-helix transcriptional regulator, partial [Candidatus Competibacteraceae bacterium]|nr:helix-turn-helix transcriptional regulator [Candidatus Competibacteraceae bacterium]
MAKKEITLLPTVQRRLQTLGDNLRLARLRRDLSSAMVAERAGISRQTLSALENGSGSVSMATWVQVLFVLGLEKDLDAVARDDELVEPCRTRSSRPASERARQGRGTSHERTAAKHRVYAIGSAWVPLRGLGLCSSRRREAERSFPSSTTTH